MTDNEIIKALECHKEQDLATCQNCPFLNIDGCAYELSEYALDLINRQKAMIEALKMDNEQLQSDIVNANMNAEHALAEIEGLHKEVEYWKAETKEARADIDQAVAEAIKEFAEKMKGVIPEIDDTYIERIVEDYIDNLVKEMVGEDK